MTAHDPDTSDVRTWADTYADELEAMAGRVRALPDRLQADPPSACRLFYEAAVIQELCLRHDMLLLGVKKYLSSEVGPQEANEIWEKHEPKILGGGYCSRRIDYFGTPMDSPSGTNP